MTSFAGFEKDGFAGKKRQSSRRINKKRKETHVCFVRELFFWPKETKEEKKSLEKFSFFFLKHDRTDCF
jgi:hypothetical protein